MTENAAPGKSDLISPYAQNNVPFLVTLALLILLPGGITYFGPSILTSFGDAHWMGIGWGVGIILTFIADENLVPGKNNLSSGVFHTDHLSHRLVRNPLFLVGLGLLVLVPPPITFYGPVVLASSPDWIWLIAGWIVAALGALLMYSAIKSVEATLQ
ncbi:MAG TPA: hypothetical protein VGR61_08705 [Candidatus Dormibacteraeota bacterium]|nr:hypothetical protein [Candidatus Dormibacteraeota bacterium]